MYGAANEKFGGVAFDPDISKLPPRPYEVKGRCSLTYSKVESWLLKLWTCSSDSMSKETKIFLKN